MPRKGPHALTVLVVIVATVSVVGLSAGGCAVSSTHYTDNREPLVNFEMRHSQCPKDLVKRGRVMVVEKANQGFEVVLYTQAQACLGMLGFECMETQERNEILQAVGLQLSNFFQEDAGQAATIRQLGRWRKMDCLVLVRVDIRPKDPYQIKAVTDYWECSVAYVKGINPYTNTVEWQAMLTASAQTRLSKQKMMTAVTRQLFQDVTCLFESPN